METRAVGIYARSRWLGGPVGHEVLGCNHPLLNAGRRSRTVAADAEDAFAPVGILDSQNCVAVSPPSVDQINDCTGSLEICESPTGKTGDGVCAATGGNAAREGFPHAATGDSAGCPAACGRDEGSAAGELDREGSVGGCECYSTRANRVGGRGNAEGDADDVPADMVSRALHHWETNCYAQQQRQRQNGNCRNPSCWDFHVRAP